jgi:hypothetical protein
MKPRLFFCIVSILMACDAKQSASQHNTSVVPPPSAIPHDSVNTLVYAWKKSYSLKNKLVNRIPEPYGYKRVPVQPGSFAEWLRHLPLKEGHPHVYLYNGGRKANQQAQYAVLDIDVGDKDLQQCADAVMRLRGEYLYATRQQKSIKFHFTNGFLCDFQKWSEGYRPRVNDSSNTVTWRKTVLPADIYPSFKKYMETIFVYSGSQSLSQELKSKNINDIHPGDVLIRGGFPGHAVIVLDVAVREGTGEKAFLLAQSYMPAQDIHVLVNPHYKRLSPWYIVPSTEDLVTPEWTFKTSELKEF